jgi:membrane-bound metal-dependent hydrolase YbcI (DUF457 family)
MPSPIGHALGGAIVALVAPPTHADRMSPARALLWPTAAAVLPDLDFLWGRHSMETHSLAAAASAGLVVLAWTRGRGRRLAVMVALAWASHVLFDWLGSDDTPPLGVMALWPFTSDFYFAHAYVFEAISRRTWLPNFWSHNLRAVAQEIAMLGPAAVFAWWWRGWTRRW